MKKRIFLVSHGKLAEGMANALGMLVGNVEDVSAMGLMPGESPADIAAAIEKTARENPEDRILILADLLGGSVSNAVTRLALLPNVRLVNGMNLAAVIGLYFAAPDIDGDELEALLADARRGLALADPGRWKNTGDEEEIL